MRLADLKQFLVYCFGGERGPSASVHKEVLDHVMPEGGIHEIQGKEVIAYEVDGTIVILSENGLVKPKQVIFTDLVSGASFLQEIES